MLERAIASYEQCLRGEPKGSTLAADARSNSELAKALLARAKVRETLEKTRNRPMTRVLTSRATGTALKRNLTHRRAIHARPGEIGWPQTRHRSRWRRSSVRLLAKGICPLLPTETRTFRHRRKTRRPTWRRRQSASPGNAASISGARRMLRLPAPWTGEPCGPVVQDRHFSLQQAASVYFWAYGVTQERLQTMTSRRWPDELQISPARSAVIACQPRQRLSACALRTRSF